MPKEEKGVKSFYIVACGKISYFVGKKHNFWLVCIQFEPTNKNNTFSKLQLLESVEMKPKNQKLENIFLNIY